MGDKRDNGSWTPRDTAKHDNITEHQARTDAQRSGYENFGNRKATDSEYDKRWEKKEDDRRRDNDKGIC